MTTLVSFHVLLCPFSHLYLGISQILDKSAHIDSRHRSLLSSFLSFRLSNWHKKLFAKQASQVMTETLTRIARQPQHFNSCTQTILSRHKCWQKDKLSCFVRWWLLWQNINLHQCQYHLWVKKIKWWASFIQSRRSVIWLQSLQTRQVSTEKLTDILAHAESKST